MGPKERLDEMGDHYPLAKSVGLLLGGLRCEESGWETRVVIRARTPLGS